MDQSRAEFEEWAKGDDVPHMRLHWTGGSYDDQQSQAAWMAWQAAMERSGRSELLEALKKARNQLDEDCFTDESKAACLDRIDALIKKHTKEQDAAGVDLPDGAQHG